MHFSQDDRARLAAWNSGTALQRIIEQIAFTAIDDGKQLDGALDISVS